MKEFKVQEKKKYIYISIYIDRFIFIKEEKRKELNK